MLANVNHPAASRRYVPRPSHNCSATTFAAASTISEEDMAYLIHRLYNEQDPLDDDEGLTLSEAALLISHPPARHRSARRTRCSRQPLSGCLPEGWKRRGVWIRFGAEG
jgi:hypothetical protein